EAAAVEVFAEIFHVIREKVQISRFGHIDEGILKELFAVDVYNLIRVCIGVCCRQPPKRSWKHRVAIRVIVMPGGLPHLYSPPGLRMVSNARIDNPASINVARRRQILFSGSTVAGN